MDKDKKAFVDTLAGKPVPRDMFGTIIGIDDIIVWGNGSHTWAGLNFGQVTKINRKEIGFGKQQGESRVSSVTVRPFTRARKTREWNIAPRKKAVSSYRSAWVLENPPQEILNLLGDDSE